LSSAYESIGNIQTRHSDASEAVETQRKAVMLREQLLKDDPANVESGRLLAAGYLYLGDAMVASGDIPAALESYRQTLPIRERLYAADETNAADARSLARSYQRIGNVLMQTSALKDDAELGRAAWETHRKALLIREKLSAADPTNAQDRRDLADEYVMKAPSQMAAGDARKLCPIAARRSSSLKRC
jgi:tetratricopeptide (TPR) repeat protein